MQSPLTWLLLTHSGLSQPISASSPAVLPGGGGVAVLRGRGLHPYNHDKVAGCYQHYSYSGFSSTKVPSGGPRKAALFHPKGLLHGGHTPPPQSLAGCLQCLGQDHTGGHLGGLQFRVQAAPREEGSYWEAREWPVPSV